MHILFVSHYLFILNNAFILSYIPTGYAFRTAHMYSPTF